MNTLNSCLKGNASCKNRGITFIDGADSETYVSYQELYNGALRTLNRLQDRGVKPKDELILQLDDNVSFLFTFWACILGGIIPVPLSIGIHDDHRQKLIMVWKRLRNPFMVTDELQLQRLSKFCDEQDLQSLYETIKQRSILIGDIQTDEADPLGQEYNALPDDIAFIQYSSGSTGEPKGVVLTHSNLVANTKDIKKASKTTDNDSMLSWMPLTHDMGMICFHLTGVSGGLNQYLMPTALFIRRPVLWLAKASEHRVSQLYSPNFGYQYFLSSFSKIEDIDWDLSCIRIIYNGAEPISKSLCEQFVGRLKQLGLGEHVIFPGYGLAEASVAVTLAEVNMPLRTYHLDRQHLNIGEQVEEVYGNDEEGVTFIEVGRAIDQCAIRICDDADQPLPDDTIGNIQIKGFNVTSGYYQFPEANRDLFTSDGWLRTGDLGFIRDEALTITGRKKNIIIINGQNYYPQDIERAVEQIHGLGLGKVVAVGHKDNMDASSERVLVFVLFKRGMKDFIPLMHDIRKRVLDQVGVDVDAVVPVKKIPKTTSGKIQHFKLLEQYKKGLFNKQLEEIDCLQEQADIISEDEVLQKILSVWRSLFGTLPTEDQNLLEAGMNSLKAMRFTSALNETMQTSLAVSDLFSCQDFQSLAEYLKLNQTSATLPIPSAPVKQAYPLTPAQERLWLLDQFHAGEGILNIPLAYRLTGPVDINALEVAITMVLQRHDSLRTYFQQTGGKPQQLIADFNGDLLDFELVKNPDLDEASVGDLVNSEARQPVSADQPPLFRVRLFSLGEERYLLSFVMNHLIIDGWSLYTFFEEVRACYQACKRGVEAELQATKIQYKDYVEWSEHSKLTEAYEHARKYWLEQLDNCPTEVQLLSKRLDNSAKLDGKRHIYELPRPLVAKLRKFSEDRQVTEFMTLVSIINVLLYKYSGQRDIVIGTDSTGRTHRDTENIIGYFLNTLCLRSMVDPDAGFERLLQEVKTTCLSAFKHQVYAYEDILKEKGENSLFNVLVIYQNFGDVPAIERLDEELVIDSLTSEHIKPLVDLHFEFVERGDSIWLHLIYDTSVFKDNQTVALTELFAALADECLSVPDKKLSEISMILPSESELLDSFNSTHTDYGPFIPLSEMIRRRAEVHPDEVALYCECTMLTYHELNKAANLLATALREDYGIKSEDRVAIVLQRSPNLLIAILGVLNSGAAYVPVDPDYPEKRIGYMLADSSARVVITGEHTPHMSDLPDCDVVNIDTLLTSREGTSEHAGSIIHAGQLAYVMYTSGSTGTPKGVMIEHEALTDYVRTFISYFGITEQEVVLQQSSASFDTFIEEVFPALCMGGKVVILKEGGRDIQKMLQTAEQYKVTLISATPLIIRELNERAYDFKSLRIIISGGDRLFPDQINRLYERVDIYNTYGPTESTVCATYNKVTALGDAALIGSPIPNRQVYIIGDDLNILPIGLVGEIALAGKGLARGYLNKEDLTREQFFIHDFSQTRIYRTGDLGRWLPDGRIEFLGRKDQQLKIRGYRVETGEIEQILLLHEDILGAAVNVMTDAYGDKHICAFYESAKVLEKGSIMTHLAEYLPAYMMPTFIVRLERLPVTTSGKLDYKALPDPTLSIGSDLEDQPGNDFEKELVKVFKEVLKRDHIGVNDNFFILGGNSLKATFILHKILEQFNVRLEIKDIFKNPTVRAIAELLGRSVVTSHQSLPAIKEQPYYNLSHAQKRLWILNQLEDVESAYNMLWAYELHGQLDVEVFKKVFGNLVERHESLRTIFKLVEGEPRQFIKTVEECGQILEYIDYSQFDDKAGRIEQLIEKEANFCFDLAVGPLLSVKLVKASTNKYLFLLNMHHIISDGWSMEVLSGEITTLYNALKHGEVNPLDPLTIQYKDYACWQSSQLEKDTIQSDRAFWMKQFEMPVSPVELPLSKPRPAVRSFYGEKRQINMDAGLVEKLTTMCSQKKSSLFITLVAAVKVLLYKFTGQRDIVVGIPALGREHPDLKNQVGFYVNNLPLRSHLSASGSFGEFLEQVKANMLNAFEHQAYPFDLLVEDLDLTRDRSHSPLFDVMVVLENIHDKENGIEQLDEVTAERLPVSAVRSVFDYIFTFRETHNSLSLEVTYNKEIFDSGLAEKILSHFQQLISLVSSNPEVKVNMLDLLSGEERGKLLETFNNTAAEVPEASITELFEHQVCLTPHATAVVCDNESVSYAELNLRANQLARVLKEDFKVLPDYVVGVEMGHSVDLIICLLGILKSGACYLPIDPAYPEKRKAFMVEDAAANLILTDEVRQTRMYDVDEIYYPDLKKAIADTEANDPKQKPEPGHLVYVVYTSGSTGTPKGVMIEHRSLVNLCFWHRAAFSVDERSRASVYASIGFDALAWEVWPYLLSGSCLFPVRSEFRTDLSMLSRFLKEHAISHSYLPTVVCERMHQENSLPEGLLVLTGGDALKRLGESPNTVINNYGPTEGTVVATSANISDQKERDLYPIGRPISNTQIYIVDEGLHPVPEGVTGEICIVGAGLARGYINQPELTEERFVMLPFGAGMRAYLTGDLGRWLPDGQIEFIGRKDSQIQLNGYRIELEEISCHLIKHSKIESAVTLFSEEGAYLISYYCGEVSVEELQGYLQESLPSYMVPRQFVKMSVMPLTANGKIDKRALPQPEQSHYLELPVGNIEEVLSGHWAEYLKKDVISRNDDLFLLGGNSLIATRLIGTIYKSFGVQVSLKDLFMNSTLKGMAAFIANHEKEKELVTINPIAEAPRYEVSHAQKRLWLTSQTEKSNPDYNIFGAYLLKGNFSVDVFCEAFSICLQRHESLRTRIISQSGLPYQVIVEKVETNEFFQFVSLKEDKDAEDKAKMLAHEEAYRPFDLAKDLLFRVKIIELEENRHILLFNMHHIISDGWSMEIMMDEIVSAYISLEKGDTVKFNPLSIQYKDYAYWLNDLIKKGEMEAHEQYWLNQFRTLPEKLKFPVDFSDGNIMHGEAGRERLTVTQSEELRLFCRENKVSLFMTLTAVIKALLYSYTRQPDITLGTPMTGRTNHALADQLGLYVNTVALRTQFSPDDTFLDMLDNVKTTILQAEKYQLLPFDILVESLGSLQGQQQAGLFNMMVSFQEAPEVAQKLARMGVEVSAFGDEVVLSKYDIEFNIVDFGDQIDIEIDYNKAFYRSDRIVLLKERLAAWVEEIVEDPTRSITELSTKTYNIHQQKEAHFSMEMDF